MPLNEKNNAMRTLIYSMACLALLLAGCTQTGEPEELSPEQKHIQDSLSKAAQKLKADSIKRKNPLLIVPPDSTYTGDYTDRYASGIVKFRGYFRLGLRHGQWMSFYPNGLLWSEMHYDKGLRHGPNTAYFDGGQVRYSGFYKNDLRDSIWSYYDSTGVLRKKLLFKNDRVIKEFQVPIPPGLLRR